MFMKQVSGCFGISLYYWRMLIKRIVQDGKILVAENTGCFIKAFDQI